jgi:hypothetical protein
MATFLTCANRTLIARDPEFAAVFSAVLAELGVPVTASSGAASAFRAWFDVSLRDMGWSNGKFTDRARGAAEDQLLATAALRLVARRAWAAAAGSVDALDAMLIGSIGRGEASCASDFDLLFVGNALVDLAPNGVDPAADEYERSDMLRARPWRNEFVQAARAAKYNFPGYSDKPDLKVVCADELWDQAGRLSSEQRIRHGTNALACGHELRTGAGAIGKLLDLSRKQPRDSQARHRITLMKHYLSNPDGMSRPHNAHGFLSQTWQAIMFFCNVPMHPRTPYWRAPMLVPLDAKGQRTWANAVHALYLMRRCDAPPPVTQEEMVRDAAKDLVRCARESFGLAANAAREISAVLDDPDAY